MASAMCKQHKPMFIHGRFLGVSVTISSFPPLRDETQNYASFPPGCLLRAAARPANPHASHAGHIEYDARVFYPFHIMKLTHARWMLYWENSTRLENTKGNYQEQGRQYKCFLVLQSPRAKQLLLSWLFHVPRLAHNLQKQKIAALYAEFSRVFCHQFVPFVIRDET